METNGSAGVQPQMDSMMLESFMRDARKAVTWLEEQHNTGFENIENKEEVIRKFTIIVHGIKSSLWNIGETSLADTAFKLEKSARDNNIEQICSVTPDFTKDLFTLLEKLELKQNEQNKDNTLDEDKEFLQLKLNEIQEMCSDYNRKGALKILAEIKNYSKKTKEVLDIIMHHVNHSEFEEAQKAAAEYVAEL